MLTDVSHTSNIWLKMWGCNWRWRSRDPWTETLFQLPVNLSNCCSTSCFLWAFQCCYWVFLLLALNSKRQQNLSNFSIWYSSLSVSILHSIPTFWIACGSISLGILCMSHTMCTIFLNMLKLLVCCFSLLNSMLLWNLGYSQSVAAVLSWWCVSISTHCTSLFLLFLFSFFDVYSAVRLQCKHQNISKQFMWWCCWALRWLIIT